MRRNAVDFNEADSILAWLAWSGQLMIVNGKLRLWRRYKGSIYPEKVVEKIYEAARSVGAEVMVV